MKSGEEALGVAAAPDHAGSRRFFLRAGTRGLGTSSVFVPTFLGDFDPSQRPLRTLRSWSYSVKMKPGVVSRSSLNEISVGGMRLLARGHLIANSGLVS